MVQLLAKIIPGCALLVLISFQQGKEGTLGAPVLGALLRGTCILGLNDG
jgi:hypothetical protein